MDELLTSSGTEIARLIRTGEVTAQEALEIHIDRISSINPSLNAMVQDRFEEARAEAREADEAVKVGKKDLPPFHGVPCTIKESIAHQGMPNTCGLVHRKGIIPEKDATAVARLRQAGAISMGVTNIPELCMWMETHSQVYGLSRNPYNPDRITGGSSGGEGAIIGGGGSPFGLGSDIAGSIRYPAFFNGIFGHKPTGGLVPNTGQHPPVEGRLKRYLTTGVLARRTEDLMPLLKIIAGPDGEDESCIEPELKDPRKVNVRTLKLFNIENLGHFLPGSDLRLAQQKCVDHFEDKGTTVLRKVTLRSINKILEIWLAVMMKDTVTPIEEAVTGGEQINFPLELGRMLTRRSHHTIPGLSLILAERFSKVMDKGLFFGSIFDRQLENLYEEATELKDEISKLLGRNGVLIYPSYTSPAPKHTMPLLFPLTAPSMVLANIFEFPATQVPLGLNKQGLPLGIQVIGNHGQDHITISVAMELEKAFGGWVPPWEARGK